jgi:hypothetical protein
LRPAGADADAGACARTNVGRKAPGGGAGSGASAGNGAAAEVGTSSSAPTAPPVGAAAGARLASAEKNETAFASSQDMLKHKAAALASRALPCYVLCKNLFFARARDALRSAHVLAPPARR